MDNGVIKQKNLFLFFPMYVCLGTYYLLSYIAAPFIKLWVSSSTVLYNNVKGTNMDNGSGANMSMMAQDGIQSDSLNLNEKSNRKKKPIRVSQSLVTSREKLLALVRTPNDTRSEKPVTYRYTALNPDGKMIYNTFLAYSKTETFDYLEGEGYTVFKIETSDFIEKFYGAGSISSRKMKTKDIVFWLQQLSTYLKSGIPLTDSMRILSKQMGKKANNKKIFDGVIYNLTLGEIFSSAMEKQGDAFPTLLINIIKSAEATGDLEGSLDDMAEYYGETEKTRKSMISALTYPVMVMVFSLGVVIFILIFLLPKFEGIYNSSGASVPGITKFLLKLSKFMKANIFTVLLIIIIMIVTFIVCYKKIKAFRYTMQTFLMKMPVIGNVVVYKEMMIFTKTFANLLKNNVFITESMDILQKVTNNEIYREVMINTVNYIGRGDKISSAFQHWAIPDVAYYMMVTGESTGELAKMMENVATYYSEQHKMIIDSMKSLIEPILIIFLAITVGGIMIAVIVPMFSLYSQIM